MLGFEEIGSRPIGGPLDESEPTPSLDSIGLMIANHGIDEVNKRKLKEWEAAQKRKRVEVMVAAAMFN